MKPVVLHLILLSCLSTMATSLSSIPLSFQDQCVDLPNGIRAQVVHAIPSDNHPASTKAPIVFLHGSFHGPWCWQEHFFPFFVERGHPVLAYASRGTSGTFAGEGVRKVKAEQHVEDLMGLFRLLPSILDNNKAKPIVVCHSFGGILFMKYLEHLSNQNTKPSDQFAGIVMVSSVPPSGYGQMTKRVLKRSWRDSYKIVRGIPMKGAITNANLCRDLFFGGPHQQLNDGTMQEPDVTEDDLARFQAHFAEDSKVTVDTSDLTRNLPSKEIDSAGRAKFVSDLPPVLVVGSKRDIIVDYPALEETARYFGLQDAPTMLDSGHDSMLGRNWERAAREIHDWIQRTKL